MGKPRALKNRDSVPSLKIDSNRSNKRIDFDNFDESNYIEGEIKNLTEVVQDVQDSPEEVKADSYQILQLKEQLESATLKKDRKKKRVRSARDIPAPNPSANEFLEDAVLNDLDDVIVEADNEKSRSNVISIEVVKDADILKPHKKYIGNFEMTILQNDEANPVLNFQLAKDVEEFDKKKSNDVQRVRYTNFMRQKQTASAKSFRKVA